MIETIEDMSIVSRFSDWLESEVRNDISRSKCTCGRFFFCL